MSFLRIHQSIFIIAIVCISSHLAEARDITTLQTALALAQDDMEKAKNKHEASAQAFARQKLVVEEQKRQLAEGTKLLEKIQMDNKQASEQYIEAKQKYEKAQSTFKEAWDNNNK